MNRMNGENRSIRIRLIMIIQPLLMHSLKSVPPIISEKESKVFSQIIFHLLFYHAIDLIESYEPFC